VPVLALMPTLVLLFVLEMLVQIHMLMQNVVAGICADAGTVAGSSCL